MLPPLRAALGAQVEYQSTPQPALRPQIDLSTIRAANQDDAQSGAIASASRLDMLSMSGQSHLAKGLSVFAETVGQFLKISRREGEPLPDYTARLVEAVRALSPAERAILERSLNQLVKGLSLRLLGEILRNPLGPDIARLNVRMETAQLGDRDPVTKAVVSSYRLNDGAEPAVHPQNAPRFASATAAVLSATQATPATDIMSLPVTIAPVSSSGPFLGSINLAQALEDPETVELATPAEKPVSPDLEARPAGIPDTESPVARVDMEAQPDAESVARSQETAADDRPEPEQHGSSGAAADEVRTGKRPEIVGRSNQQSLAQQTALAPVVKAVSTSAVYDAPALVRLSHPVEEHHIIPTRQRTQQPHADRSMVAIMTEWLAEIFTEETQARLESQLPQRTSRLAAAQEILEELMDFDKLTRPAPVAEERASHASANASTRPSGNSTAEQILSSEARASLVQAGAQNSPVPEAQQQVMPMMPGAFPREGMPLPYVTYPPAVEPPQEEEPETRAISPTDEDGEQQQSEGNQDNGPADGDGDEEPEPASPPDGELDGQANDFYWRMADWS